MAGLYSDKKDALWRLFFKPEKAHPEKV